MKRFYALIILVFIAAYGYCDDAGDSPYRGSDAFILSLERDRANMLQQTLPFGACNIGYQKLFQRWGFSVSLQTMSLEDSSGEYPTDWENDDGYVILRQVKMSMKPVFVISESKLLNGPDSLFYCFGSLVLKDRYAKGHETFTLSEFLPYEAGFGLGFDVRLFRHLAIFAEASYYNRGVDEDYEEYSEKRMDHYFCEVIIPMAPWIEAGLKIYL